MGKKPDKGARQAGTVEPVPVGPLEDDLRDLYAAYSAGGASDQTENLAAKVEEAWRDQNRRRPVTAKKVQIAE